MPRRWMLIASSLGSALLGQAGTIGTAEASVKCPPKMGYYTLRKADTCQKIANVKKFNFSNSQEIEKINRPLSGFRCGAAEAGQIICYRSS